MNSNTQDAPVIIIIGASARSAAFSALRAGLSPHCADLFADADLSARCLVQRVAQADYPQALAAIVRGFPPAPWMYTGALENRLALVRRLARQRPFWGNDAPVLARVRSPEFVHRLLTEAGLPSPRIIAPFEGNQPPTDARWLVKPLAGAGGVGIHFLDEARAAARTPCYLQEFVEGEPCAAIYVAHDTGCQLLGVTRQLIGEDWLHARPFHYCGSVGPLPLAPAEQQAFQRLGDVLVRGCGLRGIFGVDCVLCDGLPWPVEINPRYTASVEVLEYALGVPALALHRSAFDPSASPRAIRNTEPGFVAKAILFAAKSCRFPDDGPFRAAIDCPGSPWDMPAFADIPQPGESIPAGRPVLTMLLRAPSLEHCVADLRRQANRLKKRLSQEAGFGERSM